MVPLANSAAFGLLLKVLERIGRPQYLENALARQGLPVQLLDAPDIHFPLCRLPAVYEDTLRKAGVRSIGGFANRYCRFSDLGLFGRYVTDAPDLVTATRRALRAHHYHASQSTFGIEALGSHMRLGIRCAAGGAHGWRHVSDTMVALLADLVGSYAGPTWRPVALEVDYPEPAHKSGMDAVLDAPIEFDRPSTAIVFERNLLSRLRQRSAAPTKQFTFHDLRRLVLVGPPADFAGAVRRLIRLRLLDGHTDIEGVAALLDMGHRTLQRRLRERGLSYRDVLADARMERAVELLTVTRQPIADVAFSLGYSSATHLSRAFKRSLGRTPSEMRALALGRLPLVGAR